MQTDPARARRRPAFEWAEYPGLWGEYPGKLDLYLNGKLVGEIDRSGRLWLVYGGDDWWIGTYRDRDSAIRALVDVVLGPPPEVKPSGLRWVASAADETWDLMRGNKVLGFVWKGASGKQHYAELTWREIIHVGTLEECARALVDREVQRTERCSVADGVKLELIDWLTVELIQLRSFHGTGPTSDELRLLERALREDPKRYKNTRKQMVREYAASLGMNTRG